MIIQLRKMLLLLFLFPSEDGPLFSDFSALPSRCTVINLSSQQLIAPSPTLRRDVRQAPALGSNTRELRHSMEGDFLCRLAQMSAIYQRLLWRRSDRPETRVICLLSALCPTRNGAPVELSVTY